MRESLWTQLARRTAMQARTKAKNDEESISFVDVNDPNHGIIAFLESQEPPEDVEERCFWHDQPDCFICHGEG